MTAKRLNLSQVVLSLLCTAFILISIISLYNTGLFNRADNFLFDLRIKWRGSLETSGKIVLVLLDEKSAIELKRKKGSWSRRQLSEALRNLCQAGAEIIGLDMILGAPDLDPQADTILAHTIAECNNVVLARVSSAPGIEEIAPLPLFQEGMIGDGFIDVPLDTDEVLRKIRFFNAKPQADGELQLFPAFSLEIARVFLNLSYDFDFSEEEYFFLGAKEEKQLRLPYPELLINYYGDYKSFVHLSYADVVLNRFEPEIVKGRIVLVGSILATQKDFLSTPLSRFKGISGYKEKFGVLVGGVLGEKEPGVACHAHATETILNQNYIVRMPTTTVSMLIILLGIIGLMFYSPRVGTVLESCVLLISIFFLVWISYMLFLKKLLWIDTAPLIAVFFTQFVVGVALEKTFARKKSLMVTSLFGKYVSPSVVNKLIRGDITVSLEGKSQELSILFSDLRGFTTISEGLGARQTGILLNNYFDAMIPLVFDKKGTLDKLMGDAIMAFFGAPVDLPDHPVKAAEAALSMLEKLAVLNSKHRDEGMAQIDIGIGLNTGVVTVGNLGSREFMDYTIIGDDVNLASRLEGLNKVYGTHVIVSDSMAKRLDDRFLLRDLDLVRVKGKGKAVTIYELMGFREKMDPSWPERVHIFETGLVAFRTGNWDEAEEIFRQILQEVPDDKPSSLYIKRIEQYRAKPPLETWDGVTVFDHK